MKTCLRALALLLAVAFMPQSSFGQVFETRTGVDTLSLKERISIHTNVVDWTLMIPNVGIEFDVRNTNWNRWAVGFSFKSKWQTNSTFKQRYFYTTTDARVYFRNYWRTRQITGRDNMVRHTNIIDRAFSCRRTKVKHPRTTYYRGVYASFSNYSFKIPGFIAKNGRQGISFSAGVTYGCVYPLYQFASGNSLDLELGIDAGVMATKVEKFNIDADDKCYVRVSDKTWKIVPFPVPTEARLGFVYRIGKYPITKRYRWREDVDVAYAEAMRDRRLEEQKQQRDRENAAKTRAKMEAEFWAVYDSIAVVNAANAKVRNAELAKQKLETERIAAEKQRAAKEAARKQREEEKTKQKAPADTVATDSVHATMVDADSVSAPQDNEPTVVQSDEATDNQQQTAVEVQTSTSEENSAEESTTTSSTSTEETSTEETSTEETSVEESSVEQTSVNEPQTPSTYEEENEGKEASDENN